MSDNALAATSAKVGDAAQRHGTSTSTKLGLAVLVVVGFWLLRRLWKCNEDGKGDGANDAAGKDSTPTGKNYNTMSGNNANVTTPTAAPEVSAASRGTNAWASKPSAPVKEEEEEVAAAPAAAPREVALEQPEEKEELLEATKAYSEEYKARIAQMVMPSDQEHAHPFIGFSLADNIQENALIVDGIFEDGPAFQGGVRIDDDFVSIEGNELDTMDDVRAMLPRYCRPGKVTLFHMRRPNGEEYDARVWVMTAEERFRGKPYFFDAAAHERKESSRPKKIFSGLDKTAKN